MKFREIYNSREWVIARRAVLALIVVILGFRLYGGSLLGWLEQPSAGRDIVITRAEFRADLPGSKPAWIIGLRNQSRRFTYKEVEVEATYMDKAGAVVQKDKLTVHQVLTPGDDKIVGSSDYKERPGAVSGLLKVLD